MYIGPSNDNDIDRIFTDVCKSKESVRRDAIDRLYNYVVARVSLTPSASPSEWEEEVGRNLLTLVKSKIPSRRRGAVLAIDTILDIIKEDPLDNRRNLFRFYNHLTTILHDTPEPSILTAASQLLGRLTQISGAVFGDHFIEDQIPNFLEMGASDAKSSLGPVLVLKEFARHSPASFFTHLSDTFRSIFSLLRNSQIDVRDAAAQLMGYLLAAMGAREFESHQVTIRSLVVQVQQGLESNSSTILHGSLLALREFFLYAKKELLEDRFLDMCESVFRFRSHADPVVRRVVVAILPTLALYDTNLFCDHFFVASMGFLIGRLDSGDSATAYLAIGHLSSAVGVKMIPFVVPIFQHMQRALQSRHTLVPHNHIFETIGLLARSLGPSIAQALSELFELLFTCELSESFVRMLETIVRCIPVLLGVIQEHLLDLISMVLRRQHYRRQGTPRSSTHNIDVTGPTALIASQATLALTVLGNFNFRGHLLNEFIVDTVIPYIDHDDVATRKAAVSTTCKLLSHDPVRFQSAHHAIELITITLDKVLSAGVVDSDSGVRLTVLSSLDTSLDLQLAQAEYIRLLMIALHDEVVDNRIAAVGIIGRLASHNPSQVLPPLRKTLIRLLTELKCSITSQSKENAIRILAALMVSTHAVVENYVTEVLDVVLDCAREANPVIATHVLICLGELSAANATDTVSQQIPRIMTTVLSSLEGSSQMRTAALDCLGRLCTNTGYVIVPIEEYPQLLPLLHGMLKREQSPVVRLQVIRVIGLLGAIDPDRYQVKVQGVILMESSPESINAVPDKDPSDARPVAASDDPYQDLVIDLLLDTLQQQALSSHHHLVIDSFISIAKTCGVRFASAVPKIMPTFCSIIRSATPSLQGYYLGQLTFLAGAIRQHIRTCILDIVDLIHGIWDSSSQRLSLVILVETLADILAAEFGPHTARLIPRLLRILQEDKSDFRAAIQVKAITALTAFASNLQEYLNLVVPTIISCYECARVPFILRRQAIQSLGELSNYADLYPYTSRITHSLTAVIAESEEKLRQVIIDALCTFAYTLGSSFVIFVPGLTRALVNNYGNIKKPLDLFERLLEEVPLPPFELKPRMAEMPPTASTRQPNRHLLKRTWDVSRVLDSHEAWIIWYTQLAAQFVKESPSVSLRSCMNLLDAYPHISTQLFNPALASCWGELTEPFQEDLIQSLQHVVSSPSVPPEVAHYMLDLVEYMERKSTPLPISHGLMADYCYNLQAYAKALHHRELQFFQDIAPSTIEALIDINVMLRQGDAALGTLNLARQHYDVRNPETWYEKLGRWSDALQIYEAMDESNTLERQDGALDVSFLGRLRCLHALGEWERVAALTAEKWPHSTGQMLTQLAPLGAAGAWHTGAWSALENYYLAMERNSGDRAFYGAVSSIQQNRLSNALSNILKARDLLDPELTSLLDESPDRLDRFSVQAQMISELEELVLYKELADRPHRQQKLRETWKKRLMGCQRDVNVWQRILKVRSLAVKPEEDIDTIVRFANLCRKSGRLGAAQRAMETLVRSELHESKAPPQIVYAQLKLIWANGDRANALASLQKFIHELSQNPQPKDSTGGMTIARILARCHLKYGDWQVEIESGLTSSNAHTVLHSYHLATKYDPQWSKAWHAWAISNLDIIRPDMQTTGSGEGSRTCHKVAAIEGFFRSLQLMTQNKLQDTLSLLTLWFKFGTEPEVTTAMTNGFKNIASDIWLDVVPQIIARIQIPTPIVKEALTRLLGDIGLEHPQALVYPLTVAAKSPSLPRQDAALKILNQLCSHSRTLVEQTKLVGKELSRVAVSWGELWHEGLQRSGRHYFSGDSKAMLESLQSLYDLIQAPITPAEIEFKDVIGPSLEQARVLCLRHMVESDKTKFDQAWGIFLRVYQQLEENMPDIQAGSRQQNSKSLDLHSVSPQLLRAVNMELAVPGTYLSGHAVVKIAGFKHNVPLLKTKQHPRQVVIMGNDGRRYVYLLKGHEDLRQDERVMQVIGLVNTLLARDRECLTRRLHLQRYTVTPLAPDVGLIGWMASIDTLQNLIVEYRNNHKILADLEHRMILQDEPEFDTTAPLPRKVQVFESVLSRTTGQDLYRIFWLKSISSEAWVARRTTYTRSLAVGNMICYVLGVGDRHPGNIMIERKSGKVIHIDFGDCFEVSFERDVLPEKVPFRLTRMLRHAMEVCGIQGGFKKSCEISLDVLRENKESLLAVLEALIYDPLINWRLVQTDSQAPAEVASSLGSLNAGPNRRIILSENEILDDASDAGANREVRNERALAVYSRVENKLTGRDFGSDRLLPVSAQIERLIQEATSSENLCQLFHGWCAFW